MLPFNSNTYDMITRCKAYCTNVVPLVFDNELSFLEKLCAFSQKLNEIVDAINKQNLNAVEFQTLVTTEINAFEKYCTDEINANDSLLTALDTFKTSASSDIVTLKTNVANIQTTISQHGDSLVSVISDIANLNTSLANLNATIPTLVVTSADHETRIDTLESDSAEHTGGIASLNLAMAQRYTKTEVDNAISALTTGLDWKEAVETYEDIATTYPSPEKGWTVYVKSGYYSTEVFQFNGTEWKSVLANSIPMATTTQDGKMSYYQVLDLNALKNTAVTVSSGAPLIFTRITSAAYYALANKDPNTLYMIIG
jgi:uncharacterized coiled-coil protein SlyX